MGTLTSPGSVFRLPMEGRRFPFPRLATVLSLLLTACGGPGQDSTMQLEASLDSLIAASGQEIAIYYRDLLGSDSVLIHADLRMHAASTMKVPVMIQLFLDRDAGILAFDDSLQVKTTFRSIADGSPYTLQEEDDSDSTLYKLVGKEVSYDHLIDLMITYSSNLATNILMEKADPRRVTATMRGLGADSMEVLRGVEDGPAFQAGLSNTTTARDLGTIMSALGREEVGTPESARQMLEILGRQHWRTKIPALLPEGTRVAHKTGRINGISHDCGVVFPDEGSPYVLVILTRGFEDGEEADAYAARISRMIYDHHVATRGP